LPMGDLETRMASEVTQVIVAIGRGDPRASEALLPLVYEELKRLAEARLASEPPGQTIGPTALVHEAYLRLVGSDHGAPAEWDGRGHFFAAAAHAMRRILVDRARSKRAAKRGGGWRKIGSNITKLSLNDVPAEVIDLDEALTRLREVEPQHAKLVELRFFAGLTMEQSATVLGISAITARRHWALARAWLYRDMTVDGGDAALR